MGGLTAGAWDLEERTCVGSYLRCVDVERHLWLGRHWWLPIKTRFYTDALDVKGVNPNYPRGFKETGRVSCDAHSHCQSSRS